MQRLPQADFSAGGNDLRFEQIAAASVVQGHVSSHAIQAGDVQPRTCAKAGNHPERGLEDEAQARPGHVGAQCDEASEGQGEDG